MLLSAWQTSNPSLLRHHQIEEDQSGQLLLGSLDCLQTVYCSNHNVVSPFKETAENVDRIEVVIRGPIFFELSISQSQFGISHFVEFIQNEMSPNVLRLSIEKRVY